MTDTLFKTFPNQQDLEAVVAAHGYKFLTSSGVEYTDLTSGQTGHAILGWNDKDVIKAITDQLSVVGHTDCKTFQEPVREEFSDLFIKNCDNSLKRLFFSGGSGAEACEAAIHLSYQSHCEKGKNKKNHYISRHQSYHGATTEAMSLGDRPNLNFYSPLFPHNRSKIPEHNQYRKPDPSQSNRDYENQSVEELDIEIKRLGPENVGGFVGETIMGGLVGDVPPTKNYWKKIRAVCDKYDIHLILDEVWCGFGTSGKLLCCDWDNITPDLLFTGKGLAGGYIPLSCVVTTEDLYKSIKNGSGRTENSTTFQGHSTAVAAGLACLKKITNKTFLNDVTIKGDLLRTMTRDRLTENQFFRNVRGRGLRNSIEYDCEDRHKFGANLAQILRKKHGIIISGKWHRLSIYPALTISKNDIEKYLSIIFDEFEQLSSRWTQNYRKNLHIDHFF